LSLERSDVEHIAILARIGLTEEEIERFQEQLSHILDQFQVLNELDTTGVSSTGGAEGTGMMRDDVSEPSASSKDVLSNAPRLEGEFFRVKVVLEE